MEKMFPLFSRLTSSSSIDQQAPLLTLPYYIKWFIDMNSQSKLLIDGDGQKGLSNRMYFFLENALFKIDSKEHHK